MIVGERQRDRVLAVTALAFAGSLIAGARGIEDSLLADAVGAGGVPQGVGIAIAVAAATLLAKTFLGARSPVPREEASAPDAPSFASIAVHALVLVAILLAYALLLPWLGYPLSVSLLVLASGWLAGARLAAPLLLCGVLSGPLLWVVFDRALQVRMPVGNLWN